MTTPTEAPREALPDLDPKRMLGYDAIRYVAGYPESYVKEYAAALLESERQAHAAEVERLRVKAERYDWLRDPKRCEALGKEPYVGIEDDDAHPNHWALTGEQADAAIDQAIARGTK